jgi:hypothetical protein
MSRAFSIHLVAWQVLDRLVSLKLSCCFDVGIALAWYLRVLEFWRSEEQNHDHTVSAMSSATSSCSSNKTSDYRARLAARLRGQAIVVPDVLQTTYNCPTVRLNDTKFLVQHLDIWREKYVPNASKGAIQENSIRLLLPATSGVVCSQGQFYCSRLLPGLVFPLGR